MKKIVLVLFSILVIATMLIGVAVSANAQGTENIPVPAIPAIDRPYQTIGELGIDFEKIDAYFPRQIEIRYEEGKVYVEDFGASSVEIYDFNSYAYVNLELTDGFWTAELSAAPTIVHIYSYDASTDDRHLSAAYHGDGYRDHYVRLNDNVIGIDVSFAIEYGNVTVIYGSGNYYYEDRYEDGVLNTHGVSNREDKEGINEVLYGVDGKIRFCRLYTDGYYYYFPEQGWSSNWEKFVACDAPAGYENIDETYFTANKPSLICSAASGDDIVHDMSTAYCTSPSTCKNGCGYTIGEIEHHEWQIVDGKKECSLCDAVFFPDFEFIDRTYNNLEELGFPYDEIKAVFPKVLTVQYEDGKYMVKDVGADKAKAYNSVDYKDIEFSLVDGWWICELDEEIYNDESIKLFVYFEGKIDGIYWNITYINGTVNSDLYLMSMRDDLDVSVYYDDYDRVVSMYYVGDRLYNDEYKNGALDSQEASLFVGEDRVYIEYLADGSVERVRIYIDNEWYYYYPDGSWEKGVEALLAPPAGYENADVAYFESILPTTINCAHKNYSAADCENPEYCLVCGILKEGSEPLGHDYVGQLTTKNTCSSVGKMTYICQNDASHTYTEDVAIDENAHEWDAGTVTAAPTCTTKGTKTFVCKHNGEHTRTEDVAIDENAHKWNEGTVTTAPTCTATGTKTFVCEHNEEHTRTEDVAIDENAHKWNEGTVTAAPTCTTTGTKTFVCEHNGEHTRTEDVAIDENAHTDSNEDYTCDGCGAELPKDGLSGGAVAGIVTGATVVAGTGGFSLFWFVIKKKKWSDLIRIFKK
ncbi:MAG: hypothetical protein IKC31_04355 [Clostridia bacterium]|nr:hypothetical protein [Clostridia bacterium]